MMMSFDIEVPIRLRFKLKLDRQAIRKALRLLLLSAEFGSLVGGLHQARPSTSEDINAFPRHVTRNLEYLRILGRVLLDTGAAKDAGAIETILVELSQFVFNQHGTLIEESQPLVEVPAQLSAPTFSTGARTRRAARVRLSARVRLLLAKRPG